MTWTLSADRARKYSLSAAPFTEIDFLKLELKHLSYVSIRVSCRAGVLLGAIHFRTAWTSRSSEHNSEFFQCDTGWDSMILSHRSHFFSQGVTNVVDFT